MRPCATNQGGSLCDAHDDVARCIGALWEVFSVLDEVFTATEGDGDPGAASTLDPASLFLVPGQDLAAASRLILDDPHWQPMYYRDRHAVSPAGTPSSHASAMPAPASAKPTPTSASKDYLAAARRGPDAVLEMLANASRPTSSPTPPAANPSTAHGGAAGLLASAKESQAPGARPIQPAPGTGPMSMPPQPLKESNRIVAPLPPAGKDPAASLKASILAAREQHQKEAAHAVFVNGMPRASAEPLVRSVSDMVADLSLGSLGSRSSSLLRTPGVATSLPQANTGSLPRLSESHPTAPTPGWGGSSAVRGLSGTPSSLSVGFPGTSYVTPSPGAHIPAFTPRMPAGIDSSAPRSAGYAPWYGSHRQAGGSWPGGNSYTPQQGLSVSVEASPQGHGGGNHAAGVTGQTQSVMSRIDEALRGL